MARTGSFGRLPRAVPSLTATLLAIAREQQQQEDQNIMDAWQKGGVVNGQKVTDSVVLAHWQARLKDISPDDPLYDTYKNVIYQYQYSIDESKHTAAYAQLPDPSAGDDAAMAAFYMNWSRKVPKDSEFYRVLLRDAGQFIRSAKAKRDAKTRENTEKQYKSQMDRLEKTHELPGQTALRWLTMLGQEGSQGRGAVLGESPTGGTKDIVDSTNITSLQLPGVEQMLSLLGTVMTGENEPNRNGRGKVGVNQNVLFTDENGQPVTGQNIVDSLKAADPGFDGHLSLDYVKSLVARQRDGLQKRIDLARKTGHVSDMVALTKQQAKVNEYGREIAAWPVAEHYNRLHDELKAALGDPSLLPDAKVAAITRIRAEMGALASDPRIAEDGHMQSQLRGEAEGKVGTATLAEDLGGFSDGYKNPTGNSDVEFVNSTLEQFQTQKDAVEAGQMVYTQGDYVQGPDGKPLFAPSTQGKSIGAATMQQVNNLPGVGKPVPVMVPNGDGGGATPMYVVPAPIVAAAKDADGNPVPGVNNAPVGGYIRYMVNGKETTLYSIDRGGKTSWTFDPPWDPAKVKTSESGGVIQLDLSGATPAGTDLTKNADLGNGFQVVGAGKNAQGQPVIGKLVFDPKAATLWTDAARQHAGPDPYTDSFSASLAAMKTTPDGRSLLTQWTGDPRFNAILDNEAHLAAGQTLDPMSGLWTGGDPNAYGQNINQMHTQLQYAKTGNSFDSNPALRDAWWRDQTDLKMTGAPGGTVPGPNGSMVPAPSPSPLPSTTIQSDPSAGMKALGSVFHGGGGIVSPDSAFAKERGWDVPNIKVGQPLTLPGVPAGIAPSPTPAPSASPTPSSGNIPQPTTMPTPPPPTSGGTYGQGGDGQRNRML